MHQINLRTVIQIGLCVGALLTFPVVAQPLDDSEVAELSLSLFSTQGDAKAQVIEKLTASADRSLIPTLVLAMRWTGSNVHVASALSKLTGENIVDWHDAYNWQQAHPEIQAHSTYRALKLRFLINTDPRFSVFFNTQDGSEQPMSIRLEEVVWGGALYEGIPSLDNAQTVSADQADFLLASDLVFGAEINGDARAYPLRILGWHEMANDTIGGVPVALAYCTLCGSGILYETERGKQTKSFSFGSSGLLYRSNKLMFDRQTHSLWNQFTGKPVSGPLYDSGIKLKTHPITITSWELWSQQHPDTQVLSIDTGHVRNYDSGVTYADYFASPDLMFPAAFTSNESLARKDYVFGIQLFAASRAWPLTAFIEEPVINDHIGATPVVLIGQDATRTVRAYQRNAGEHFEWSPNGSLTLNGVAWDIREDFILGPSDTDRRARLPGHVSYWFAWDNFQGARSTLYEQSTR